MPSLKIGRDTNLQELLIALKREENFRPFGLYTRQCHGFLVQTRNHFAVDESGLLLAVSIGEGEPLRLLRLADVLDVRVAAPRSDLLSVISRRLKTAPFCSFQVVLINGVQYRVHSPGAVMLTNDFLFIGQYLADDIPAETVTGVRWDWVDDLRNALRNPEDNPN